MRPVHMDHLVKPRVKPGGDEAEIPANLLLELLPLLSQACAFQGNHLAYRHLSTSR